MALHDTTARKVAIERIREAQENIKSLKTYLDQVDQAIEDYCERDLGGPFYLDWGEGIIKDALAIYGNISRCNGALLVRATEPTKEKAT